MSDKIEWAAPEYEYYRKGKSWLVATSLIFISFLLLAIWTKNLLFAIFIGLSYFLIVIYAFRKPPTTYISIKPKGIGVNTDFYNFNDLKSFWIFYSPPEVREISLHSRKKTKPYIKIPLGDQNPVEIRSLLIKYIPEEEQGDSLIDNLFRNIGF